jgi:hypothetical protein
MDDIIKDVNEGWEEEGQRTQFRGSDDYLRQKVSEIQHTKVLDIYPLEKVRGVYIWGPCFYQTRRLRCER